MISANGINVRSAGAIRLTSKKRLAASSVLDRGAHLSSALAVVPTFAIGLFRKRAALSSEPSELKQEVQPEHREFHRWCEDVANRIAGRCPQFDGLLRSG